MILKITERHFVYITLYNFRKLLKMLGYKALRSVKRPFTILRIIQDTLKDNLLKCNFHMIEKPKNRKTENVELAKLELLYVQLAAYLEPCC